LFERLSHKLILHLNYFDLYSMEGNCYIEAIYRIYLDNILGYFRFYSILHEATFTNRGPGVLV